KQKWVVGRIVRPLGPRNYEVEVGSQVWKRHQDQIRGVEENARKEKHGTEVKLTTEPSTHQNQVVPYTEESQDIAEPDPGSPSPDTSSSSVDYESADATDEEPETSNEIRRSNRSTKGIPPARL